jgi:hypothetical protein
MSPLAQHQKRRFHFTLNPELCIPQGCFSRQERKNENHGSILQYSQSFTSEPGLTKCSVFFHATHFSFLDFCDNILSHFSLSSPMSPPFAHLSFHDGSGGHPRLFLTPINGGWSLVHVSFSPTCLCPSSVCCTAASSLTALPTMLCLPQFLPPRRLQMSPSTHPCLSPAPALLHTRLLPAARVPVRECDSPQWLKQKYTQLMKPCGWDRKMCQFKLLTLKQL